MKCKRCGTTMNRVKDGEHSYRYECPKCHLIIRAKQTPSATPQNKDEEASLA